MICNMTPIPLGLIQHIAFCFPPGDHPFPPRFALALTLVAKGAAVKGKLVEMKKYVDMFVEHFWDIIVLGQDPGY